MLPQCQAQSWEPLLPFIAGALTAVFAEPIRKWLFKPSLEVVFRSGRPFVMPSPTAGPGGGSLGRYVRVQIKLRNKIGARVAKGCRAYLSNVEREVNGVFQASEFADSLRLTLSSQPPKDAFGPIDIVHGATQFVDVLSTDRSAPTSFEKKTSLHPFYCQSLFDDTPKKLRLTVLVTSDDAKPASGRIVFDWKGQWDTFDASPG